jgi:hypothetical protein
MRASTYGNSIDRIRPVIDAMISVFVGSATEKSGDFSCSPVLFCLLSNYIQRTLELLAAYLATLGWMSQILLFLWRIPSQPQYEHADSFELPGTKYSSYI